MPAWRTQPKHLHAPYNDIPSDLEDDIDLVASHINTLIDDGMLAGDAVAIYAARAIIANLNTSTDPRNGRIKVTTTEPPTYGTWKRADPARNATRNSAELAAKFQKETIVPGGSAADQRRRRKGYDRDI